MAPSGYFLDPPSPQPPSPPPPPPSPWTAPMQWVVVTGVISLVKVRRLRGRQKPPGEGPPPPVPMDPVGARGELGEVAAASEEAEAGEEVDGRNEDPPR
ncbi:uncharacterized protein PV07_10994 [Cladophialophora immunda]|uniref:Uncharacterized protein n=1 Tax=Cladophialophora immunda TaxID=569365 RepID=A0A0D2BUH8_9EURO|nr:uncharacterized protein PV07_10994 [Cladophialophora immunda]KIW22728.1 hypothetical protein PV07_10994 [Cladophialophora immunda]